MYLLISNIDDRKCQSLCVWLVSHWAIFFGIPKIAIIDIFFLEIILMLYFIYIIIYTLMTLMLIRYLFLKFSDWRILHTDISSVCDCKILDSLFEDLIFDFSRHHFQEKICKECHEFLDLSYLKYNSYMYYNHKQYIVKKNTIFYFNSREYVVFYGNIYDYIYNSTQENHKIFTHKINYYPTLETLYLSKILERLYLSLKGVNFHPLMIMVEHYLNLYRQELKRLNSQTLIIKFSNLQLLEKLVSRLNVSSS